MYMFIDIQDIKPKQKIVICLNSCDNEQQSYPVRAVHGWTRQSLLPIFEAESLNAVLMSGTDKQFWEDGRHITLIRVATAKRMRAIFFFVRTISLVNTFNGGLESRFPLYRKQFKIFFFQCCFLRLLISSLQ